MVNFYIVECSLILYPLLGWTLIRFTKLNFSLQKALLVISGLVVLIVCLSIALNIITTYTVLNWVLATFPYLFISILLWVGYWHGKSFLRISCVILMFTTFSLGYLLSTIGILFTMFAVSDLDTDQKQRLSDNLIYYERNIGQGPDPSIRNKQVEVYKKLRWLPILATRVTNITYDAWDPPLQRNLDVSLSKDKGFIYLHSKVEGYKTWNWKDTVQLGQKHYR